jgi:hypothetical protein
MLGATGCIPSSISGSPLYATVSFHPDTYFHAQCAFDGDDYYYIDAYGADGSGIYRTTDFQSSELFYQVDGANSTQMQIYDGYLYLPWDNLTRIRLADGATEVIDFGEYGEYRSEAFSIDQGTIFFEVNNFTDTYHDSTLIASVDRFSESPERVALLQENGGGEYDGYDFMTPDYGVVSKTTGDIVFQCGLGLCYYNEGGNNMVFPSRPMRDGDSLYIEKGAEEQSISLTPYHLFRNNILEENDRLILLLQSGDAANVYDSETYGYIYNLRQAQHETDALIVFDPETEEIEYLYETSDEDERIVGYYEGRIYLFEEEVLYRMGLDAQKRDEIGNLEKGYEDYIFEVCGKKLLVWGATDTDTPGSREYRRNAFVGAFDL